MINRINSGVHSFLRGVYIFFYLVLMTNIGLAAGPQSGTDNRTDGVSLSFNTALQYTNLFTGSAAYQIAIDVPPGPGGLAPSLALAYNSDRGNGWLGMGWDIRGLNRIERSTRYGIPSYDEGCSESFIASKFDRFDLVLNGKPYEIFWDPNQGSYTTNPVAHFHISYECKENRIDRWKIIDKSGTSYVFKGVPAVGRVGSRFFPIERETDIKGNSIAYTYQSGEEDEQQYDPEDGDFYPDEITYGSQEGILVTVRFEVEKRKVSLDYLPLAEKYEEISNFKGGSKFIMDKRIKRISVESSSTGLIRVYDLEYYSTRYGHLSLLSEVRVGSLAHKFEYQGQKDSEQGFEKRNASSNLWPLTSPHGSGMQKWPGVTWFDINGDSLADMVWGVSHSEGMWGFQSIATQPFSWDPIPDPDNQGLAARTWPPVQPLSTNREFPAPLINLVLDTPRERFAGTEIIDVNNDGFLDVVHALDGVRITWLNKNGKGWEPAPQWALPQPIAEWRNVFTATTSALDVVTLIKLVDVNGDQFPDIVHPKDGTFLNRGGRGGTGWESTPDPLWKTPVVSDCKYIDFGFGCFEPAWETGTTGSHPDFGPPRYYDSGVRYIDLNGDGLKDIIQYFNHKDSPATQKWISKAWINMGFEQPNDTAYAEDSRWLPPSYMDHFQLGTALNNAHLGTQIIDINLDGLPDLVFSLGHESISSKAVAFNTPHGFEKYQTTPSLYSPTSDILSEVPWLQQLPDFAVLEYTGGSERSFVANGVTFADFDGDGAPDIGQSRMDFPLSGNVPQRKEGIWANKFRKPLLTKISTPYGATVEYRYNATHSDGQHTSHQDPDGVNRLPYPKQVVSSIKLDDGIRNAIETEFAYRGGQFDFNRAEFRGFREVSISPDNKGGTNPPAARTVYRFSQDDERLGQIAVIRTGERQVYNETIFDYISVVGGVDSRGMAAHETLLGEMDHLNYDSVVSDRDLVFDMNFDATGKLCVDAWQGRCPMPSVSQGVSWTRQAISNTAVYFDHDSDRIVVPASGISFPALSIQAWVWPQRRQPNVTRILVEKESAFRLFLDETDELLASVYDGSKWTTLRSGYRVPTNQYTHVAFSFDGKSRAGIAINGRPQAERVGFNGPINKGGDLFVGSSPALNQGTYLGYIDELKIFRNAVKVPQITRTSYTYDKYGNISLIDSDGDVAYPDDNVIMETEYSYNEDRHILNQPGHIYVREAGSFSYHKIRSATWYDYDEKGNLKKETLWGGARDGEGKPLKESAHNPETVLQYDSWGNVTELRDPLGHATKFVYPQSFPALPTQIENHLGHVVKIEYYGIPPEPEYDKYLGLFGQVKRITDPNDLYSRFVYDNFGRIRAVYGPNDGDIDSLHLYPSLLYNYRLEKLVPGSDRRFLRASVSARTKPLKSTVFDPQLIDLSGLSDSSAELEIRKSIRTNDPFAFFNENYLKNTDIVNVASYFDGFGRILQVVGEGDVENSVALVDGITKYDGCGRVQELYKPYFVREPSLYTSYWPGGATDFTYLNGKKPVYQTPDFEQPKVSYEYDPIGRVNKIVRPNNAITSIRYDQSRVTVIDPNGHKATYTHDAYGRLIKVVEFKGQFGEYAAGEAVIMAPERDRVYNLNELLRHENGIGAPVGLTSYVTEYEYDLLGNLIKIIDPGRNEIELEYDTLGRRVAMRDPDMGGKSQHLEAASGSVVTLPGKRWKYAYDLAGNLIEITNAKGQHIGLEYDGLNRLIAKRYYDLHPWVVANAGVNDAASMTGLWHETGHRTDHLSAGSYAFNHEETHSYEGNQSLSGELIFGPYDLKDYDSPSLSVAYYWDTRSSMVAAADIMSVWASRGGQSWDLLVNSFTLKTHHPAKQWGELSDLDLGNYEGDKVWIKFVFNSVLPPNFSPGHHEGWYINSLKIQGRRKINVQPPIRWEYDKVEVGGPWSVGRLVRMRDLSGSTEYRYDNEGKLREVRRTIGEETFVAKAQYDQLGRLETLTYPGGNNPEVLEYVYGRDGHLNGLRNDKGSQYIKGASYDASGNLRKIIFGNGIATTYSFDDQKQGHQSLKSILTGMPLIFPFHELSTTPPVTSTTDSTNLSELVYTLQSLEYGYDLKRNVAFRRDKIHPEESWRYGYDEFDRLVRADVNGTVKRYLCDALGNIRLMDGVIHQYDWTGFAGPHGVTSLVEESPTIVGFGKSISYDENGNIREVIPLHGPAMKYSYDYENRLKQINENTQFIYDGFGDRVKSVEGGDISLYPFPFLEIRNGIKTKYYLLNGTTIARREDSNTAPDDLLFHHPDHLGSVHLLTNAEGKEVARVEYHPYGGAKTEIGTIFVGRNRFTGKRLDESGLYYFGARYYDPEMGRFITPDPLDALIRELVLGNSQQLNLFNYALNNPINVVDPVGLQGRDPREYPPDKPLPELGPGEFWDFSWVVAGESRTPRPRVFEPIESGRDIPPQVSLALSPVPQYVTTKVYQYHVAHERFRFREPFTKAQQARHLDHIIRKLELRGSVPGVSTLIGKLTAVTTHLTILTTLA